jgi:hypothetical protein
MQEQMHNVTIKRILRKNQKEMLEDKNTITEMKNVFDRLIHTLDLARELISGLENMII